MRFTLSTLELDVSQGRVSQGCRASRAVQHGGPFRQTSLLARENHHG